MVFYVLVCICRKKWIRISLLVTMLLFCVIAILPFSVQAPPSTNPYMAVVPDFMFFDEYTHWIRPENSNFSVDLYIKNLESEWALQNASFSLSYNTPDPILSLLNVTIYQEWAGPNTVDTSTPGQINVFIQNHHNPQGDVPIASLAFKIIFQGIVPPQHRSNLTVLTFSNVTLRGPTGPIPTDPPRRGFVEVEPHLGGWYHVRMADATLSKSVVCQGYTVNITATMESCSYFAQDVNRTIYANTTIIQTENITLIGEYLWYNVTFAFTWNTTSFAIGNHIITASVIPYSGDRWSWDNDFTAGWVIISITGDITGPDGWPDGKVDIRDVAAVAKLYGVNYPNLRYNPNFDVNNDLKIDIKDVAIAATHYGNVYP